jgi:hypothetical protein
MPPFSGWDVRAIPVSCYAIRGASEDVMAPV